MTAHVTAIDTNSFCSDDKKNKTHWNKDYLMLWLQQGEGRDEFVQKLGLIANDKEESVFMKNTDSKPDRGWRPIISMLREAASHYVGLKEGENAYQEMKEFRCFLLNERRRLLEALAAAKDGEELEACEWALNRHTKGRWQSKWK